MNLITEDDFLTIENDRDKQSIIRYADGSRSVIPRRFFIANWKDEEANFGTLQMGRAVMIGVGSTVKVDHDPQALRMGRFIAMGERIHFTLNAQHAMKSITTFNLSCFGPGFREGKVEQYGDMVFENDIWVADEAMFLGGCHIANGTVIGARSLVTGGFKTEPFGIYAGTPARLIRFRMPEKVRELLLELAWWDQPMSWIKANADRFAMDLTEDVGRSCEMLTELKRSQHRQPLRAAA
jgi:acetyltransferase-like isoleucine patch superfamily enzyme